VNGVLRDYEVALCPMEDMGDKGILAINMRDKRDRDLLDSVDINEAGVNIVETRAMVRQRQEVDERNETLEKENCKKELDVCEGDKEEVVDQDEDSIQILADGKCASVEVEAESELALEEGVKEFEDDNDDDEPVDLHCIKKGNYKQQLVAETKEDVILGMAYRNERGLRWEDGLILSRQTDLFYGSIDRIVLPKNRRQIVMETAHEEAGHLGYCKVEKMIKQRFVWPLLGRDVRKHCM